MSGKPVNAGRTFIQANEGRCDHCGGAAETRDGDEYRCACGGLLGRFVPGGIELKCRRCKRTFIVPVDMEASV